MAAPGDGGTVANLAFAFQAESKGGTSNIYVTTADGSATKRLTPLSTKLEHSPTWAPDGSRIAFLRNPVDGRVNRDLYTVRPDGTALTLVRSFPDSSDPFPIDAYDEWDTALAWSPDGSKIVFSAGIYNQDDLFVLDVNTGAVQTLLPDTVDHVDGPDFSPDLDAATPGYQGRIAFSGIAKNSPGNADLFALDVTIDDTGSIQAGGLTNLTNTSGGTGDDEVAPAWSPDGRFLTFHSNGVSGWASDLMVAQVSGNLLVGPHVLVTNARRDATWSPDSRQVGFHAPRALKGGKVTLDLYRIRPDGTGLTPVTRTDGVKEFQPDWNPAWANDIDPAAARTSESASGGGSEETLLRSPPATLSSFRSGFSDEESRRDRDRDAWLQERMMA